MTDDKELGWFHRLSMDDKVRLLRNPDGALPPELVEQFLHNPGVYTSYWVSEGSPDRWALTPEASRKLNAQRDQLDWWWSRVEPADQAYLVAHRAEELSGEYADLVMNASSTAEHAALVVVMVRDNRTGRFRLPHMMDVFVELQARDGGS
jgi:hypothetical protein